MILNLLKHHFWRKEKKNHDMPGSHYTAPEMFLLTDTKFKQELGGNSMPGMGNKLKARHTATRFQLVDLLFLNIFELENRIIF